MELHEEHHEKKMSLFTLEILIGVNEKKMAIPIGQIKKEEVFLCDWAELT